MLRTIFITALLSLAVSILPWRAEGWSLEEYSLEREKETCTYKCYYGSKCLRLNILIRGYYFDDQRLANGLESTFAAEAGVGASVEETLRWGKVKAVGEFLFNQTSGRNAVERESFASDSPVHEPEAFSIADLYLQVEKSDFTVKLGKTITPFGRYYFPLFSNSKFDAPFVRTESVLWYETGAFVSYKPGVFSLDLALTNGERDKDSNSSKAGIARIGAGGEKWAVGVSAKKQDGAGSEFQKVYKNHAGFDFMLRSEHITFSGEAVYDEYGCRTMCDEGIEGRQSLYNRDVFLHPGKPIIGRGGYLDLLYQKSKWLIDLNYGQFYPEKIGVPYHDDHINRALLKVAYNISAGLQCFAMGLIENNRINNKAYRGDYEDYAYFAGLQYKL